MPALAVADALRASGAEVVFIGGERAERDLVPARGYDLRPIRARGLSRTDPLAAARALGTAAGAVRAAGRILADVRPDAVMGGGGYVAGPVGLAAALRRIPLVLTEADSHLGLANRALAPLARRVCLAFPIRGREGARYRVTGRPVPPPAVDRAAARAALDVPQEADLVLVFGGSLGSRAINQAALAAFRDAPFRVLHVAGARDFPSLAAPRPGYDLREYLADGFAEALAAADLVVARSGGSVFEIAAAGRPAILVPYPHAAGDHQAANARWMEAAGAAVVIPDGALTAPILARAAADLLGDRQRLAAMGRASASLARPQAAQDVATEVLAAAASRRGR